MRPWEALIPPEDRLVFEKAGFHYRQPFGRRPVLLVVDVVTSFTGSIAQPVLSAIEEFPCSCGENGWAALPAISRLLNGARAADIPVVFTKGNPVNKFFCGDTNKDPKSWEEAHRRYGAPIHPNIAPRSDEWVLEKTKASAFFGTPLATYLAQVGADCLLVCGTATSGCLRVTSIDGWSYGYPVFVVEEGCFDRSNFFHLTTLYELNAKYANVILLADALSYLAGLRE